MSSSSQPESTAGLPAQYEFDSQQDRILAGLSQDMRWVAVPLMFVGVMYGIACAAGIVRAFSHPEALLGAIFIGLAMLFYLALGTWTQRAAVSFYQITRTQGRDVTHLMGALENLRKMYALLSLIVKIYVAVVLITLVAAVIMMIAGAFKA
jgi:hypothetical protein